MNQIEFFVNQDIPWNGVDLYIKQSGAWVSTLECSLVPEGQSPPVAMRLSNAEAQALMDRLYQAGIRPTAARGGEATLAAVERHLEDMREIAFNQLEMNKP